MVFHRRLTLALAALVPLFGCGGPAADGQDDWPPSVILISLDTLRADHMSLYGYERETTPFLEELAAEAAVYERAFSTSCWTLISQMTMRTGFYPQQHGVVFEQMALSPEVPLPAERLEAEGYQTLAFFRPGWIQLEGLIALYDGNIAWVDALLREWWAEWERRGLLEDTLVVITSDHGESLGQRGKIKGHGAMWQDGLHVPLAVRYPDGHLAGERPADVVSHVDILPTVLDVLGLPLDRRLPGYSLLAKLPLERVVRADKPPGFTLVQWPRKLIGGNNRGWLFDLDADPLELAQDRDDRERSGEAALVSAFEAELAGRPWVEFMPVPAGSAEAGMSQELEALGYGGDDD